MDIPQYETRQTALLETSRELLNQTTSDAVAEIAVETAHVHLELPVAGIYLADADEATLRPVAAIDTVVDRDSDPPSIRAGDSLAWQAFETGERRSRAGSTDESGAVTDRSRGKLAIPLGDHGVFLAESTTPDTVDDRTVSLATFLAGSAETALGVLDREQQLRRQQDRLAAFIGNISHDLRSPLAVARSGVEVARRTDSHDSLDRVDRAHDRIQTLVEDLLTLAREGRAIEQADLDAVELSTVATDAWAAIETTTASIDIDAAVDRTVVASRSRLQQLLENLFRNSIEHGSTSSQSVPGDSVEHGSTSSRSAPGDSLEHETAATSAGTAATVRVRVGPLAEGFYVEDDGPGIDASDREAVFETGYSTRDGGTGLGLRIVRTVVDAHGWDLTVTEADTGGARFEITGLKPATGERG